MDNFFGDNSFWQEDDNDEPYDPSKEVEEEEEEDDDDDDEYEGTTSSSSSESEKEDDDDDDDNDDNNEKMDLRTATPKRRKKRKQRIANRTRAKLDMKDFDWDKHEKDLEIHDPDAWLPSLDMFTEEEKDYRRFLMNDELDGKDEDEDFEPGDPQDGFQSDTSMKSLKITEQEIQDLLAEPEDEMTKMIMSTTTTEIKNKSWPISSDQIKRIKTQLNTLCQLTIQSLCLCAEKIDKRLIADQDYNQVTKVEDVLQEMKTIVGLRDKGREVRKRLAELPAHILTRRQREKAQRRILSGVAEDLKGFTTCPRGVQIESLYDCDSVEEVRYWTERIENEMKKRQVNHIDLVANMIVEGLLRHKEWTDPKLVLPKKKKPYKSAYRRWNNEEDNLLCRGVRRYGLERQAYIQIVNRLMPMLRKPTQVRDHVKLILNRKKNTEIHRKISSSILGLAWTKEDDSILRNGVLKYGYDWERIHRELLAYRGPIRMRNRYIELEGKSLYTMHRLEARARSKITAYKKIKNEVWHYPYSSAPPSPPKKEKTFHREVVPSDSDDEEEKFEREVIPSDSDEEKEKVKKNRNKFQSEAIPLNSQLEKQNKKTKNIKKMESFHREVVPSDSDDEEETFDREVVPSDSEEEKTFQREVVPSDSEDESVSPPPPAAAADNSSSEERKVSSETTMTRIEEDRRLLLAAKTHGASIETWNMISSTNDVNIRVNRSPEYLQSRFQELYALFTSNRSMAHDENDSGSSSSSSGEEEEREGNTNKGLKKS